MNPITRRDLIYGAALIPVGIALADCSPNVEPTFVAALQAVGQEISLALPQLQKAGLSNNLAGTIAKAITAIEAAASGVGMATTATQGQSVLIQIEGDINAIVPVVAPFVALVPGGAIISLVIAALPAIEAMVNFGVSLLSNQAKQVAATAVVPTPAAGSLARSEAPIDPAQAALAELLRRAAGHS